MSTFGILTSPVPIAEGFAAPLGNTTMTALQGFGPSELPEAGKIVAGRSPLTDLYLHIFEVNPKTLVLIRLVGHNVLASSYQQWLQTTGLIH